MKKEITQEMIDKIIDANESVRGTSNYTKYLMEMSCKVDNHWVFCGYGIPYRINVSYYIKTIKDNSYIYVVNKDNSLERYKLTNEIINLLDIEEIL